MTLTKAQRVDVFNKFGGKCAYCGVDLAGKKWHADHVEAVLRKFWLKGKDAKLCERPEHDHIGNMFPACVACNIHKHSMSLEHWRGYLEEQVAMARRNSAPFRHAERFGLITTSAEPIVFYFEKFAEATHDS